MLKFQGFIRNVRYKTYFHDENLTKTNINNFDINKAKAYGVIVDDQNVEIAYSQWVSPKRTRSYPFARIYNTYNNSKIVTIIPIIKDEGKDGDRDKIQYATISWMNLANIYVILGYYENAIKSKKKRQETKQKLTEQKFNNEFIKSQIKQILEYKQSALHWNNNLITEHFTGIFELAVDSYKKISEKTGVKIHETESLEKYLDKIKQDLNAFQNISQKTALSASQREVMTSHEKEYLANGEKGILEITNYLGGTYYLTVDEVYLDNGIYIIQESKNSNNSKLPKITDIQDGLFKLILFSNLDSLKLNNKEIKFLVKLKLTGKNLQDSLHLTRQNNNQNQINNFCKINKLSESQKKVINQLNLEVKNNYNLTIEISGNQNND